MRWPEAKRRQVLCTAAVMMAAAGSSRGQPQSAHRPTFRANSALVLVPITVIDRRGATVNGLSQDAFTVAEDGVRQQIRSFSEEDAPVSMGIVLDLSASMKGVLSAARESLRALIAGLNPADEAFLNTVSTQPRAYAGFTRSLDGVLGQIVCERPAGDTALIDTIYQSLKQLREGVHARKALVVISDGVDNHSRHSREELLDLAVESDAQIYAIAMVSAPPFAKPIELLEQNRGVRLLDDLAAKTGGIGFTLRSRADIANAAASIGRALRNQYIIGYVPSGSDRIGRRHSIRVKVAGRGLRTYTRTEYCLD